MKILSHYNLFFKFLRSLILIQSYFYKLLEPLSHLLLVFLKFSLVFFKSFCLTLFCLFFFVWNSMCYFKIIFFFLLIWKIRVNYFFNYFLPLFHSLFFSYRKFIIYLVRLLDYICLYLAFLFSISLPPYWSLPRIY